MEICEARLDWGSGIHEQLERMETIVAIGRFVDNAGAGRAVATSCRSRNPWI
jgi:hypothetical protein